MMKENKKEKGGKKLKYKADDTTVNWVNVRSLRVGEWQSGHLDVTTP